MKKQYLLIVSCLVFHFPSFSQGMPVYDNTNFLALGQQLIESAKQTSQLLRTVNFLKEQKERLEQVSSVVKQLNMVREIVRNNQLLYDTVNEDLRAIVSSPYIRADEVERVSQSFSSLIDRAVEDLDFMQQLLTSNYLNMTDGERLEILEAQRQRSREMTGEIALKKKRYELIIEFRSAAERINNRELQYE